MHRLSVVAAAALIAAIAAAPATAQEKTWNFNLNTGASFPVSDTSDNFKTGFAIGAGLTYNVNPRFGLQFDYQFSTHGLNAEIFDVTDLGGSHWVNKLNLAGKFTFKHVDDPGAYALAGIGAYHRKVEITKFEGWQGGIICNPWWYVCYPGAVPVERILGSRSTWDVGIDFGLGYQFDMGDSSQVFIEGRFNYVIGDKVQVDPENLPEGVAPPADSGKRANGYYIPLVIGIRF